MKRFAIAGALGLALSASVNAGGPSEPSLQIPGSLLGGIVQERDVGLVFGYLREALGAAIEGRDVSAPDEIARRAEAIGDEVKRRGAAAAGAFLDAMERSVREGMRERHPALPPSYPPQRI